jgi:hypothetical protein
VANGQNEQAEAGPSMPWYRRIIAVFVAPGELFGHLSDRPDWILPTIVGVVIILLIMAVLAPRVILPMQEEAMMERLSSRPDVSPEEIDAMRQRVRGPIAMVSTLAGTAIMHPVALVIQAAVFYWVFLILGGELTYRKALSVAAYASLIAVLGVVLNAPLRILKESLFAGTNLGILLPPESEGTFFHTLLVQVDLFTIWRLLVIAAGMAAIAKVSQAKARLTVGILWVVWIVISAGGSMLPRLMFGAAG